MTTAQTVRKSMPEGLLRAIRTFMAENDVERIDIRRAPGDAEPEESIDHLRVVMSDDETPESDRRDAGCFIVVAADAQSE